MGRPFVAVEDIVAEERDMLLVGSRVSWGYSEGVGCHDYLGCYMTVV